VLQERPPQDVFDLYGRMKKLQGPIAKLQENFARSEGTGLETAFQELSQQVNQIQTSWLAIAAEAVPKVLQQAVSHGFADLVELCFAVSHNPAAMLGAVQDPDGGNAIHVATLGGHVEMIKVLIQYGCDSQALNSKGKTAVDVAIEAWHRAELAGGDSEVVQMAIQDQKNCIELLHGEHKVYSMDFVHYKKRGIWMKRPPIMLKWLDIKRLFESTFGENMIKAFEEIDTNHSGGIVKYEWMAMFDAEGPGHRALVAAGMDSKEIFDSLDALDTEGKDMMIKESAFKLLNELDWHLTSEVWQGLLLKPLLARKGRRASV